MEFRDIVQETINELLREHDTLYRKEKKKIYNDAYTRGHFLGYEEALYNLMEKINNKLREVFENEKSKCA